MYAAGGGDTDPKPPSKGHYKVYVALLGPNCLGQPHLESHHPHQLHLEPHHPAAPPTLAMS